MFIVKIVIEELFSLSVNIAIKIKKRVYFGVEEIFETTHEDTVITRAEMPNKQKKRG